MPRNPNNPLPDSTLESLLDEALAPGALPQGLEDRILSRTSPLVAARHEPVIGRIGLTARPAFRAAAAVAIAATLGLLTYFSQRTETQTPTNIAVSIPIHEVRLARIDTRLAAINQQVAGAIADNTDLSYRIDMLDLQVALYESRPMWSEPDTSLDDPMLDAEYGLYELDSEQIF